MKNLLLVSVILASTPSTFAAAKKCVAALGNKALEREVQTEIVKMGKGRNLSLQLLKPKNAKDPVYLLLPGVNRGLRAEDQFFQQAKYMDLGMVGPNFSSQPISVSSLGKNETPRFREGDLSLKDLAEEIDFVAEKIKKDWAVENVIPVSLSYSGAVTPFLKNHSLIIEVAPMTSLAAEKPELESYRQALKAAEMWNPIFGPGITRAALDSAYRQTWSAEADEAIASFKLDKDRREDMVEGYSVLSRAVEGFDWANLKLQSKTRRVFMLAGKEDAPLLKDQLLKFLDLQKTHKDTLLIIVEGSPHAIPIECPEAYLEALKLTQSRTSGLVFIDSKTREQTVFEAKEADAKIQEILKNL